MRAWIIFWAASLIISGASFAGITVVVGIRGLRDLRDMFQQLRERGDLPE